MNENTPIMPFDIKDMYTNIHIKEQIRILDAELEICCNEDTKNIFINSWGILLKQNSTSCDGKVYIQN